MPTRTKWIQGLSQCLLICLLALIPTVAAAQTFNFATPVVLAATQTPGAWYPDRFPPCQFVSPVVAPDGTLNTLQESICATDFQSPNLNFYDTQGRKYDLPANATSASVYLYVPASWAAQNERKAALWATANNTLHAVGDYPIIEFQGATTVPVPGPSYWPNGGVAGFYGWNSLTSTFTFIGLPTGFVYDSWVKLTITLIPGTGFIYTVSSAFPPAGSVSISSPFSDPTDATIANMMLQGYNYDSDYSIYWWYPVGADTPFQVSYSANPAEGESYINLINTAANGDGLLGPGFGAQGGNICVNVYAFSPDEQEISCCSCLLTSNQVANLGVTRDLTSTTLTGVIPNSVVIKLVTTLAGDGTGTSCTNTAATPGTLALGLVAYGTTPQPAGGLYSAVEHAFVPSTLSMDEYLSITGRCASSLGNGSGFGVCLSCKAGALGSIKK